MKFVFQLLGIGLMLLGVYFLGRNIIFTTNVSPYFWRGIAADLSVFSLTAGVIALFFLPQTAKFFGWVLIALGIVCVFLSSKAILAPTSLWQYFLSIVSITTGFKLLTDRNFGG
jgi:hypothetical protein